LLELETVRNTCIEYTEQIQEAIAIGDWEKLSAILQQRLLFFESFFSQISVNEQKADVKEVIAKIQIEDAIFIQDLLSQKKKIEKQFLAIRKNRKSVKNYQN